MPEYIAPVQEIKFTLKNVVGIDEVTNLDRYQDATDDIIDAVLAEAARYAGEVVSPINIIGDRQGATLTEDGVKMPSEFKEAYQSFVDNGWNSICGNPEYGGQGLPMFLGLAVTEMISSASMAFGLCPILTLAGIEAFEAHGTDKQKATYLEKIISGEWTGSMNLTEPQAGTDVGALVTKAEKKEDGTYRIKGQKIFISFGDHDMAENIIHLVLARLTDAPKGTRGLSLFIIPKFLVNDDGSLGERNDAYPNSLEHKMGIMASPTCVMAYGERTGNCVGYLLGEENKGMMAMFTMMNNARLNVGVEGIACAERAWQMALNYAKERIQGTSLKTKNPKSPIIDHPDVRRMLMTIKSTTEAARAIAYLNAKAIDLGQHHDDEKIRYKNKGLADLLTPLSKAYGTDLGMENASLAMQVIGGMGYMEETGIAQIFRDSRIAMIYEGTNGIQAMDLVGRKLAMDGGEHWKNLLGKIVDFADDLPPSDEFKMIKSQLLNVTEHSRECAEWLKEQFKNNMSNSLAGSVPFLRLLSTTIGCYLMAKGAKAAFEMLDDGDSNKAFLTSKIATSRFYAEQIVPTVLGLKEAILSGDELFFAIDPENMAL